MIISDIDYHLVLLTYLEEHFNSKIKENLGIIIPDLMIQFQGSMKKLKIAPDQIYIHFTAAPENSPSDIVKTLKVLTTQRLLRVHKDLDGYKEIFTSDYFIKSGTKPTKEQISNFISIAKSGI